jgi:uncharacterized membrane protein YuzA (DUF378 family)
MEGCALYCFVISILGTIFLILLGLGLKIDYDFIKTENRESHAAGCFWGALIYVVFGIICFIYLTIKKNKREAKSKNAGDVQMQDIKTEKVANQTLEDDPSASLLTDK